MPRVKEIFFSPHRELPGWYESELPADCTGSRKLLLRFRAVDYDLDRHCRYARHEDPDAPHTFPHFTFHASPPGLRMGPWPGWRGIPPMPAAILHIGDFRYPGKWDFHGDERESGTIRCIFAIHAMGERRVLVESGDPGLIPESAELLSHPGMPLLPVAETIRLDFSSGFPRLLFGPEDIPDLRAAAEGPRREAWRKIVALLDNWDLPPEKSETSKLVDDTERLFPEDRVMISAFIALLEPSEENGARAAAAVGDYIELTGRSDFEPLRIDTQSGEVLFTLCIAYDWLKALLPPATAAALESRIRDAAEICASFLDTGREDYAQAHYLGCGLGLLAHAFLFHERDPHARLRIARLHAALERIIEMLPEDGFYPHGLNLWIYEQGFLLRWLELFRRCAGIDFWNRTGYWRSASRFRAAATSPDGLHGITFGDPQYRVGGDSWCHYLIAARTGSPQAMALGDFLADLPAGGVDFRHMPPRRRVHEFLYRERPAVEEQPFEPFIHFPDGGQFFRRWGEQDGNMLFTFRSGYPLGRKRYEAGERGAYGHSDPMNGAFLMYRGGEFLAAGPGPVYRRDSALFNMITIDGRGQIGDSTVWLPDEMPRESIPEEPSIEEREDFLFIRAETTRAYLPHLGVRLCERSLCLDPDGTLLGVDRVMLGAERSIEWNFHSAFPLRRLDDLPMLAFALGAEENHARLDILRPADAHWKTGMAEFVPAYPHGGERLHALALLRRGREALFAWCISFDPASRISLESGEGEMLRLRSSKGFEFLYDAANGLRRGAR